MKTFQITLWMLLVTAVRRVVFVMKGGKVFKNEARSASSLR